MSQIPNYKRKVVFQEFGCGGITNLFYRQVKKHHVYVVVNLKRWFFNESDIQSRSPSLAARNSTVFSRVNVMKCPNASDG